MINRENDRFVRLPEVKKRTGLSTATIYRKMGRGQFPRSTRLSENIVAWYQSEIDLWLSDPLAWRSAA